MKVLGVSPLDKDATASIVEDGRILFASGEERYSRQKQHSGYPAQAIDAALERTGTKPEDLDAVVYPFLEWDQELKLIQKCMADERAFLKRFKPPHLLKALAQAEKRIPERDVLVHGLRNPNQKMDKGALKDLFYKLVGATPFFSNKWSLRCSKLWEQAAAEDHRKWQQDLEAGLDKHGLRSKLKRVDHHTSHAANSYLTSGFSDALIVTLDGYGTGLAGSISAGGNGEIKRLKNLAFPYSLGSFYEQVTASLGYNPSRHAGKIVGLAAYGDPNVLTDILMSRFEMHEGDFAIYEAQNVYFSRYLASHFPMIDVAAAYQHALERAACKIVEYWIKKTGLKNVVLSGGVTANVKLNQRIFELDGVEGIFVYPNMGDGGCGAGAALMETWPGGVLPSIDNAYFGPDFTDEEIAAALKREGLEFEKPDNLAAHVAQQIHDGNVVARFGGRMEYGPRALGNRTIMYHAREPEVNHWLNQRLGRTEFMPFAPVTLWEEREKCYHNLKGAEHTAEFMTITFDCTDFMKDNCPAAVHVDGTARPQLIKREVNPGYYDILTEYHKISGNPSLINTSFNMHEEPIVCSPEDAIRAFLQGHLDALAIGSFFVPNPESQKHPRAAGSSQTSATRSSPTPEPVNS